MGTVMLKEDTKKRLTKVAADLQRESGERVDFDTAIAFLIDQYFEKKKDWDKFNEFCKPIEGINTKELIKELHKGRREDEKKFGSD